MDGRLVFQDVALRLGQNLQDLVFDVLQLLLVVGRLHDQLVLHLLQLWLLLSGQDSQQLILNKDRTLKKL